MPQASSPKTLAFLAFAALQWAAAAAPLEAESYPQQCQRTKVVVLGAGMAGITAAYALSNASISDFIIVEYNADIGGRVAHTTFGKDPKGQPYTVELGANWVQGIVSKGGPENPIWTLAKKYNLTNTYSDYSSILTYNASGPSDYAHLLDRYEKSYATLEQEAGYILSENLQDRSVRTGLSLADWKPKKNMEKQAAEWWEFDWEYAYSPEQSSQTMAIVNYNTTFYQYSDENNYVFDSRGFNTIIKGEASQFMNASDPRVHLNTIVSAVDYSAADSVTVTNEDGSCITADYAICTFSLGVLQNDVVDFTPAFPYWKQEGIEGMQMGTYTKIFLQFPPDQQFWNASTQFFLYADPEERGWYPVWQSLSGPGFLPGSGIFFVTVVSTQSYRVEKQSTEKTKDEVMAVLRGMFGAHIPDPIDFMYPRWSTVPWAHGSYSNWPPGYSLAAHQNLRANLGRLWFAGEATSAEYFGFLQGAYFEGVNVGAQVAACVQNATGCPDEPHSETLTGVTPPDQLNLANGWDVSSFLTWGF